MSSWKHIYDDILYLFSVQNSGGMSANEEKDCLYIDARYPGKSCL